MAEDFDLFTIELQTAIEDADDINKNEPARAANTDETKG